MALKKSQLYSRLWQSCDELRGGMDAKAILVDDKWLASIAARLLELVERSSQPLVDRARQLAHRYGDSLTELSDSLAVKSARVHEHAGVVATTPSHSGGTGSLDCESTGACSGSWTMRRMGSLLRFQVGFPFRSEYFNTDSRGLRLVRNADLKSDEQVVFYDGPYDDAYVVEDGDVLVGMDGDFMPCLWRRGRALLNQRVGRVLPKGDLDALFAYYALIEPLKSIESITSATTVKHLSHRDVENIERPLPALEEQTAVAAALADIDAELALLERRRNKVRELKTGMMQALLNGRIRLV